MLAEREAAKRQLVVAAVNLSACQRQLMDLRKHGVERSSDYQNVNRLDLILKDSVWSYLRSL